MSSAGGGSRRRTQLPEWTYFQRLGSWRVWTRTLRQWRSRSYAASVGRGAAELEDLAASRRRPRRRRSSPRPPRARASATSWSGGAARRRRAGAPTRRGTPSPRAGGVAISPNRRTRCGSCRHARRDVDEGRVRGCARTALRRVAAFRNATSIDRVRSGRRTPSRRAVGASAVRQDRGPRGRRTFVQHGSSRCPSALAEPVPVLHELDARRVAATIDEAPGSRRRRAM